MKIHPIVFLDIDGVLNSHQYARRCPENERGGVLGIDPAAVGRLNRLVTSVDCHIVISSTWRLIHSVVAIIGRLKRCGFVGQVIGCTPVRHCQRGLEIQEWLDKQPVVHSFVILDDDSDMGDLRHRLVKTSFETGLTEEDVDKAIEMIKRSEALLSGAFL